MFPLLALAGAALACVCAALGLEPAGQVFAWAAVVALVCQFVTGEEPAR